MHSVAIKKTPRQDGGLVSSPLRASALRSAMARSILRVFVPTTWTHGLRTETIAPNVLINELVECAHRCRGGYL